MRLINADELIVMEYGGIRFVPVEFINDAPTIDAVPVVRCKDCKWWADVDGATKKIGLGACCCGNKVMRLGFLTPKDWYCADGEREEDD